MLTDDHYLFYASSASGPWPTTQSTRVLKPLFADSVRSQSRLDAYIAQTADNDDDTLPLAHARGN